MSARPGRIKEIIDVRLDRSRANDQDLRATPEFAAYRHRIWSLLREQASTRLEVAHV